MVLLRFDFFPESEEAVTGDPPVKVSLKAAIGSFGTEKAVRPLRGLRGNHKKSARRHDDAPAACRNAPSFANELQVGHPHNCARGPRGMRHVTTPVGIGGSACFCLKASVSLTGPRPAVHSPTAPPPAEHAAWDCWHMVCVPQCACAKAIAGAQCSRASGPAMSFHVT